MQEAAAIAESFNKAYDGGVAARDFFNKHNTHVTNQTNVCIEATLTTPDGNKSDLFLDPGQVLAIPTAKGQVKLIVKVEGKRDAVPTEYTDESDRSFIVTMRPSGRLQIHRAKYNTLRQIDNEVRTWYN